MEAVSKDVGVWHEAYDCHLRCEIYFRIMPRIKAADNPQQCEICSHIGLKGNKFCRKCGAGGPNQEVESNEGYHS